MRQTRIAVAAVVALSFALLAGVGGAAATPGQGPNDANDAGPPSDLPGPVPEFVGDILGSVGDFLSGGVDALGEVVSGLTPGGQPDGAGDGS